MNDPSKEHGHVFAQSAMKNSEAKNEQPGPIDQAASISLERQVPMVHASELPSAPTNERAGPGENPVGQVTAQDAMVSSGSNSSYQPILLSGASMQQQSVIPVDPAMINALQSFLQGAGQPMTQSLEDGDDSNDVTLTKRKRTNYRQPENNAKLTAAVNVLVSRYQQNSDRNVDIKSVSRMFGVPYNTLRDNFIKACTGRPIKSRRRSIKGGNSSRGEASSDGADGKIEKDDEAAEKDEQKPKRHKRSRSLPAPFQFQPQIFAIAQSGGALGPNGQPVLQQPQYVIAMPSAFGASAGNMSMPQFAQLIPFTGSIVPQPQNATQPQTNQNQQSEQAGQSSVEASSEGSNLAPGQQLQPASVPFVAPVVLAAAPGTNDQQQITFSFPKPSDSAVSVTSGDTAQAPKATEVASAMNPATDVGVPSDPSENIGEQHP